MTPLFRPSRSSPPRTWILTLLACSAWGAALAAAPPTGDIGRVLACRGIASQAARLQCFDRAAAALARAAGTVHADAAGGSAAMSATASSPRAPAASANPGAATSNPQRNFGLSPERILAREVASGARPKPISGITARVAALRTAPDGRMIYQLDDGQTWEELEANGYAPDLRAGDRVQVSRGWLDSYWLQAPSGRGCKVQRLR